MAKQLSIWELNHPGISFKIYITLIVRLFMQQHERSLDIGNLILKLVL